MQGRAVDPRFVAAGIITNVGRLVQGTASALSQGVLVLIIVGFCSSRLPAFVRG